MARIIGRSLDFDDVMIVPKYNKVLSRKEVNLETQVTRNHKIKIPFIASNMKDICESEMAIAMHNQGGLGVLHRFMTIEEEANEVLKLQEAGLELIAASIGVKDYKERSKALISAGAKILVIDIAHGHSKYAGKVLDYLKETYGNIDIVAGNIATKDAAEYFLHKGADAVKAGIGPGKVCITRDMTGVGVHQITALMDVFEAIQKEIPIWSDGGIRKPGDVTKALGAGASAVMCGYIFAGCDETPGKGKYRGSASVEIKGGAAFVEGREIEVEQKGPVKNIIEKYLEGLASGMTYVGAKDMKGLVGKVDFTETR